MKLSELTMADCGKKITLQIETNKTIPTTITGPLRYVSQEVQWIEERSFMQEEPTYVPGRKTTELHVGPFKTEYAADTECELG